MKIGSKGKQVENITLEKGALQTLKTSLCAWTTRACPSTQTSTSLYFPVSSKFFSFCTSIGKLDEKLGSSAKRLQDWNGVIPIYDPSSEACP